MPPGHLLTIAVPPRRTLRRSPDPSVERQIEGSAIRNQNWIPTKTERAPGPAELFRAAQRKRRLQFGKQELPSAHDLEPDVRIAIGAEHLVRRDARAVVILAARVPAACHL
jgi:hypothetical protein